MTEREKVIRGLESLWRCISPVSHTCGDCPYQDNHVECIRRVVTDALALLKEQEARVMTVEEARETLHTSEFLYCEDKNGETMAGGLTLGFLNDSDYWDLSNGEYMTPDCLDEGEDLESEYGKTFRFWTSKPTSEQMRDTPWEGENNG